MLCIWKIPRTAHGVCLLQQTESAISTVPYEMSQGPLPSAGEPISPTERSLFLKACRREPTEVTPIWLMRQAGRYMAEYRAIRAKVPFLHLCKRPELAAEVTVTAAEVLGVDAAILFADILLILEPLGFQLEFAKGEGPIIHNPVRAGADVDRVRPLDQISPLTFVIDAIKFIREALPSHIPLIGFAGAVHAGVLCDRRGWIPSLRAGEGVHVSRSGELARAA